MARNGILLRVADERTRALDEADRLAPGPASIGAGVDELFALLERVGARSRRLVPRAAAAPDRLRELEDRAIRRWEARERERGVRDREIEALRHGRERRIGRSLAQYWELELPEDTDVPRVLEALRGIDIVEWACRAPELVEASVAHEDEHYPHQRYLRPAPLGIGVESAWDAGYSGAGLLLIDVERGWQFGHEDLPTGPATLVYGNNLKQGQNHGTAVLGIVAAIDGPPAPDPTTPAQGVVGIAPDADVRASSRVSDETEYDLVGAIIRAALHSPLPDVLLIEVQLNIKYKDGGNVVVRKYPVELLTPYWAAIWIATTLGITVVEPAGNGSSNALGTDPGLQGGINLDDAARDEATATAVAAGTDWNQPGTSLEELDPTQPGFCDSGAIMVGAAYEAVEMAGIKGGHRAVNAAYWGSNYGKRVDCYAWGENVRTTGPGDDEYRDFDGTSSAAAIVAGAAVLVQQMHIKLKGGPASPEALRALLSDADLNTPHVGPERPIGVMPDLQRIRRELTPRKFPLIQWIRRLVFRNHE